MRRMAAIALHSILVDVAKAAEPRAIGVEESSLGPLVVVLVSQEDRDELSILGNTRITAVSRDASEIGIRPTMTVAQAKAKASHLRVRVVRASEVQRTFFAIAEACIAFGATTAVSLDARWNDEEVVWIDVTGCAHLHGPTEIEGERVMLGKIESCIRAMGHACRVAIADGPRVAAAVARFAPARSTKPLVIPRGKSALAMHRLPVAALPIDSTTAQWLESLGLRRIGDLATLPRKALGSRLADGADDVMALIAGDDRAPLRPHVPEVLPSERVSLEYGIEHTEQIVFVAKMLCDRIGARLEGRGEGALKLALELIYDRALIGDKERSCDGTSPASPERGPHQVVSIILPTPIARANDLLSIVRTRIDSLGHQELVRAPIVEVALRVAELAQRSQGNLHMFVPEAKAESALPRLCAELAQEIGQSRVGTLIVADSWVAEARTELLPIGARKPKERARLYTKGDEPVRLTSLLPSVRPNCVFGSGPVFRSEFTLWWTPKARPLESFVIAWSERDRAMVLVRVSEEGSIITGWMD